MSLVLTHPAGLAWLLVLPMLLWFYRRSLVDQSVRQHRWSLLVRALLVVCLVLAVSGLRVGVRTGRQFVVFLVDHSASVAEASTAAARSHLQRAWSGHERGDVGVVIRVADTTTAAVAVSETLDLHSPEWADRTTDLAAGLTDALAQMDPEFGHRIVLYTDGQETRGDMAGVVRDLAGRGIPLDVIPLAGRTGPEVQVTSLEAPQRIHSAEPFAVQVRAYATTSTPARLTAFVNGIKTASREVTLAEGDNLFTIPQSPAAGRLLKVRVQLDAEEDHFVDNNSAAALVRAEGKPSVLLIESRPQDVRHLRRALQEEGIEVEVRAVRGMPRNLSELRNIDLLCLSDVPATDLSREQMELVQTYVSDFGGGFMMLGGDRSFGLGGYYQTPIEEILPVRTDFEREREAPSLAMVLVIDKSGSMGGQKIELAKDAARAAAELLDGRDQMGVIAFDSQSRWVCDLHAASDRDYVFDRISSLQAGGGTALAPALSAAYSGLELATAKLKHVIVLSDGHSTPGAFHDLVSSMRSSGITVSTVGVGEGADRALLEQIAGWGSGRYYFTGDPLAIPQIFAKETMTAARSAIQELPFQPVRTLAHPAVAGIDWGASPFLLGYVVTRPKPTGEVLLATERGDPLLSLWRYGLGRVAAFTSDAKPRWAAEWLAWSGFSRFWVQVVREVMRRESPGDMRVRIVPEEDGLRIQALVGEQDEGELVAVVAGPDGLSTERPMQRVAPDQYAVTYTHADRGEIHVQVIRRVAGQVVEQAEVGYVQGYPAELRLKPDAGERMRAWAETTGGRFDPEPDRVLGEDRVAGRRSLDLWPLLLSVALVLLPVDIALRRIAML